MEDEETLAAQVKTAMSSLKTKNGALAEENLKLRQELEKLQQEMGARMYQQKESFEAIFRSVENIAKKMSDKEGGKQKRTKVIIADETKPTGAALLAEEILEGEDGPKLDKRPPPPTEDV